VNTDTEQEIKLKKKGGGVFSGELIAVSEIFGPTVQGEGALIGTQTLFVRTGGCDYRCSWCDTGYAVLPKYEDDWQQMDAQTIMTEICATRFDRIDYTGTKQRLSIFDGNSR